jgi:predicted anti-sigma-YlaC factor YlaD
MNEHWIDRLSEYLDGELPDNERVALEAHLQECDQCTATLDDLQRVVRRAQSLAPMTPGNDLWPAIARRIGATPPQPDTVIDLATRRERTRRWAFSLPQLAAAGIALMTLSGGAVWLLREPSHPAPVAVVNSARGDTTPVVSVALKPSASQSYAAAVADLERVLAEGRGRLDTTTVRVIEQNLATIDRAIAEAQRALDADSGNMYLNTHLAETMRRKLELLRQAASLARVS